MDPSLADQYRRLHRQLALDNVALGYRTVVIAAPADIERQQVGYAVGPGGERLASEAEGAWAPEWLVIGYEDLCGDPLFADTTDPDWPVFTAAHGQGAWEPVCIADSLASFAAALSAVRSAAVGRGSPVELEQRPLSEHEREDLLRTIGVGNPSADLDFWSSWLET